jgi:hypothetical protein
MAALVSFSRVGFLVVEVVAEGPPPLVHQVRQSLEVMVVLARSSPSQASPPHTVEEVGGQHLQVWVPWQALGGQGVGAKAGSLGFHLVPLVLPTLGAGVGVVILEHQVAPAL